MPHIPLPARHSVRRPLRAAAAAVAALAAAAAAFATAAGPASAAASPEAAPASSAQADIVAGDPFYNDAVPGSRCTIGAVVTVGFLAGAYCGSEGDRVRGRDGGTGTVAWSSTESGVLLVEADDNWTPTPYIRHAGGPQGIVQGTSEAPVGASVCRSGSTTGWHCGTIQAKNQMVQGPDGHVYNLTLTSVCAEPGDTGGGVYSRGHLQGLLWGGSGTCSSGGMSYFLPINPILAEYELIPVTG